MMSPTESYDPPVSDCLGLCKVSVVTTDTLCQIRQRPAFSAPPPVSDVWRVLPLGDPSAIMVFLSEGR